MKYITFILFIILSSCGVYPLPAQEAVMKSLALQQQPPAESDAEKPVAFAGFKQFPNTDIPVDISYTGWDKMMEFLANPPGLNLIPQACDITELKSLIDESAEIIRICGNIVLDSDLTIHENTYLMFDNGYKIYPNGFSVQYMSAPIASPGQQIFSTPREAGLHIPGQIKGYFGGGVIHPGWFGADFNKKTVDLNGTGSASIYTDAYQGAVENGGIRYINHGLEEGDEVVFFHDRNGNAGCDTVADPGCNLEPTLPFFGATPMFMHTLYTVNYIDKDNFKLGGADITVSGEGTMYFVRDSTEPMLAAVYAQYDGTFTNGDMFRIELPTGGAYLTKPLAIKRADGNGNIQSPSIIGKSFEGSRLWFNAENWNDGDAAIKIGALPTTVAQYQFGTQIKNFSIIINGQNNLRIHCISMEGGIGEGTEISGMSYKNGGRGSIITSDNGLGVGTNNGIHYQTRISNSNASMQAANGETRAVNIRGNYMTTINNLTLKNEVTSAGTTYGGGAFVSTDGTDTVTFQSPHGLAIGDDIVFGFNTDKDPYTDPARGAWATLGVARSTVPSRSDYYQVIEVPSPTQVKVCLTSSVPVDGLSQPVAVAFGISAFIDTQMMAYLRLGKYGIETSVTTQNVHTVKDIQLIGYESGIWLRRGRYSINNIMGFGCHNVLVLDDEDQLAVDAVNIVENNPTSGGDGRYDQFALWDQATGIKRGGNLQSVSYRRSYQDYLGTAPSHTYSTVEIDSSYPQPQSSVKPIAWYNTYEGSRLWAEYPLHLSHDLCFTYRNILPRIKDRGTFGYNLTPQGTPLFGWLPVTVPVGNQTIAGLAQREWLNFGSTYLKGFSPWSSIPKDGFTVMIVGGRTSTTTNNKPFFTIGHTGDYAEPVIKLRTQSITSGATRRIILSIGDGSGAATQYTSTSGDYFGFGVYSLRFGRERQEVRINGIPIIVNDEAAAGTVWRTSDFRDLQTLASNDATGLVDVGDMVTFDDDSGTGFLEVNPRVPRRGVDYIVTQVNPLEVAVSVEGVATGTPIAIDWTVTDTIIRRPYLYMGGDPNIPDTGFWSQKDVVIFPGYIDDATLNTWGRWFTEKYNEHFTGGKTSSPTWGWEDAY